MSTPSARHRWPRRGLRVGLLLVALACREAAPPPGSAPEPCRPIARSELSVLTYNVHGIPAWAAGDDPEARMPRISELLNAYDVALIQEDFRYHEPLRSRAIHPLIERGNRSRFWLGRATGWLDGAGLTLFGKWPAACGRARIARPYEVCEGWLAAANDCLASKGLLQLRLPLEGGHEVDLYTTHLDAGNGDADQVTRLLQLERLAAHIEATSAGRAVILGGDFNLASETPAQRLALEQFAERLGLRDSGARADTDLWPERLDHLLYRGSADTRLEVVEAGEDPRFGAAGSPLSDHPALFARFAVE